MKGAAARRARAAALALALIGMGRAARGAGVHDAVQREVQAARHIVRDLGVHVVDLASGATAYSFGADRVYILASNTKLVTTAAALDLLGPGYSFDTRVLLRGRVSGGVLTGDLAVVGGGDPHLSGRDYAGDPLAIFRGWARRLRERGIRRVTGDVWLVDGFFDGQRLHPDWPGDQLAWYYEAPVGALSFSDNCVLVRVEPGARVGAPAQVETVPRLPVFTVRNGARTTASAKDHGPVLDRDPGGMVLGVSGTVFRGAAPLEEWITVEDPVAYFGVGLTAALAEEGITLERPTIASRELPGAGWQELTVHRTDLLTVLEVTNKRSQNLYAESLLKTLGAERCGEGSWSAGRRAVAEFLERLGLAPDTYELADGSGMSRNNRFSPQQVTHLLRAMYAHRFGPEYLASLPCSGEEDLRWERRLADPPYRGNVCAKTGYLRGVSTLSGYAKARSGKLYAFSILCNGLDSGGVAAAQDRIVMTIIDAG